MINSGISKSSKKSISGHHIRLSMTGKAISILCIVLSLTILSQCRELKESLTHSELRLEEEPIVTKNIASPVLIGARKYDSNQERLTRPFRLQQQTNGKTSTKTKTNVARTSPSTSVKNGKSLGKIVNDSQQLKPDNKKSDYIKYIIPNGEFDANSQVVYVNFGRVINEQQTNTTRLVGTNNNQGLIKRDGQILCGETNRNGKSSLDGSSTNGLINGDLLQNRIVGGNKAEPGEFPYQVRLNIRSRRGTSLCGGVIIDKRHILTAAHCVTTW